MTGVKAARERDRATLPILLLLAFLVGGGVFLRVRYLQREMLARWHAVLQGGAVTTQVTVSEWYNERVADAEALASSVSLHASVLTGRSDSGHPFEQVLAPVSRRGKFVALWVVDSAGAVIATSTTDSIRGAERLALRDAQSAGHVVHSSVMPLGPHAGFMSLAVPVRLTGPVARGVPRPAAIILRTDIVASFKPWAGGRPNAAMSMLATPSPEGPVLITACPEQDIPVCITRTPALHSETPAAYSLARVDTFGLFRSFEGERVLAVTQFDSVLRWGIVRRVRYSDALVPLQTEFAIEGAFFAVLLALAGVAAYAANRTVRVRRLFAQREAAERLTAVLDASTDGIISLDESFAITMVSTAVERMFGYSSAELLGRPVFSLFAEQWHPQLQTTLRSFVRSPVSPAPLADTERCIVVCADGRLVPVDARVGRALLNGVPLYVLGLRDVSERARTESFVNGQRQVLELIAAGAPAVETITELIGVVEREISHVHCVIYELDDEREVGRIVSAPSLPRELAIAFDEIVVNPGSNVAGSAIHQGEPIFCPDISTDPAWNDASRAFAAANGIAGAWAMPLRAADGRVIGALACYCDESRPPTARELELSHAAVRLASIALSSARDAASLRASEASFRSFVENAPAAIFRETRAGELVSANPATLTLLGYSNSSELARAAESGGLYKNAQARIRLLLALEREGVVRGHEVEWRRADGSLVTVRLSARAYRDDRGDVWLWEGHAEDVTSLRATENALRRSERLAVVGQLISGVAHELNNPLSSIMHFAEDLLADERSAADAEGLGVIRDQARRSRAIVRDLLSFVQQREATSEPLPLAEVVAATVRAMRPSLERDGVTLQFEEKDAGALILADRSGLEQIVTNLISNAAQASGRGGQVWVSSGTDEGGCVLTVEDSGAGIRADVLPRVFDPFFTTKATGEGTGLGLSVTLGIVEQFGGRIVVDPKVEGRGARFAVYLPCITDAVCLSSPDATALQAPVAVAAVEPVTLKSAGAALHTVVAQKLALIIDDEPTIRAALRRYFTRRGWVVEEAADGAAGLSLIENHGDRFGVVMSDLRMPGFSGIELHDHLAVEYPEMLRRFIFSTGDVASAEAASFVHRTSCPVLQKPFELRTLDTIIAGLVEGAPAGPVIT